MAWSAIATLTLVATLLVMSPGPNGVLVAKTVPTSGRVAGFANVMGFVAAFWLHGALSILGISIILVQSATAFTIVKYIGAAYLCWIGLRALWSALQGHPAAPQAEPAGRRRTLLRAFMEGFLTNALNPKVSMFYLAAFPQFLTPGETSALSAFVLVGLHAAINAVWFSLMVLLLARLASMTQGDRFQRWLKGFTGAVFVGFGIKLASIRTGV